MMDMRPFAECLGHHFGSEKGDHSTIDEAAGSCGVTMPILCAFFPVIGTRFSLVWKYARAVGSPKSC